MEVSSEQNGDVLTLHFRESIDHYKDFAKISQTDVKTVILDCKKISRINSAGAIAWVNFLRELRKSGAQVKLQDCSPAVVEQINMTIHFTEHAVIESIVLPYFCENCETHTTSSYSVIELKQMMPELPQINCNVCGQDTLLDDSPQHYLQFLNHLGS